MHTGPREVFGARVAELRTIAGWTTQQLSDRLDALGVRLSATGVTKLEKGSRQVLLEEAIAIAAAFNVPPSALWVPLDVQEFPLTPAFAVNPWTALGWVRGETPLVDRDIPIWTRETEATHGLDKTQRQARGAVQAAQAAERRASAMGSESRREEAREEYAVALEGVAAVWRQTERHGLRPPPLPPEWIDDMDQVGIDHNPDWRLKEPGS